MRSSPPETLITGNTYAHKDALRAMGGVWDAAAKGWRVPASRASEAQALVSGAPARSTGGYDRASWLRAHPRTGCSCGSREDAHGRYDCASCRHDAE